MPSINIKTITANDISTGQSFFIDTNILYYLHSGHDFAHDKKNEISSYSDFIAFLLSHKHSLFVSTLNLQELFHLFEKKEYDIFCEINNKDKKKYTKKQYRAEENERKKLVNKLRKIWVEIQSLYTIIDDEIKENDLEEFVNNCAAYNYDPIDYLVVEHNIGRCRNYITGDKDFLQDNRINVYRYF